MTNGDTGFAIDSVEEELSYVMGDVLYDENSGADN